MQSIKYVDLPVLDVASSDFSILGRDRSASTSFPNHRREYNADPSPFCRDLGNQISENVQKHTSQASKEANKSVAKDSHASIGTRATAAKDMVSDKLDENRHAGKEELYSAKK
ncbi:MAG: Glucose-repressible protein [Heterodermia speciosa]|uniref:Glucose-repressible protein n=1 Tax=Heterodermia speciosa TaxID=116794 RepID=A0A8H3IN15_9LECA|nr:MAG: Glucose-repressible protein [Heterodermia speciosa]